MRPGPRAVNPPPARADLGQRLPRPAVPIVLIAHNLVDRHAREHSK
jgi:hypothetical protein